MYSPIHYLRFSVASSLVMLLFLTLSAHATQVPGPLVETDWVADNLKQIVILDVRGKPLSFEKKVRASRAAVNPCGVASKKKAPVIVSGHIPGSSLVLWKDVTEKRKVDGTELQGLVLSKPAFEKLMQKSGVNNDSTVVITGMGQSPKDVVMATRLYWMMKYYGHDNMAVLNGGVKQWITEKRKVDYGKSRPKRGNYQAGEPRADLIASSEDVAAAVKSGEVQLVDARDLQDYLGLTYHRKFTAPDRKGHVPGAKLLPATSLVDTKGTAVFQPMEDIKQLSTVLGVDVNKPSITYCWSGGLASVDWYLLHELMGNKQTRLYDGSMHQWTKNKENPLVGMKME
jgi:thiosulfate/3-mercaptopyruvate sulfurtransferase